MPPEFRSKPDDEEGLEGAPLSVRCQMYGSPHPKVCTCSLTPLFQLVLPRAGAHLVPPLLGVYRVSHPRGLLILPPGFRGMWVGTGSDTGKKLREEETRVSHR